MRGRGIFIRRADGWDSRELTSLVDFAGKTVLDIGAGTGRIALQTLYRRAKMIVGKRVKLRALEETDLERCYGWINDPEVIAHLTIRFPISMTDERKWLLQASSGDENKSFAVIAEDGEHIGNVGLHKINYLDSSAELGILIGAKERWGKGYCGDAILTLLKLAFEEMNLHRVYLHVDEDNPRGIRCYEKCGFVREGTLRDATFRGGRYKNQHLMSVLSHEFKG